MGVIIGSEEAVAEFERIVKSQQETVNEMIADLHRMSGEANSKIKQEQSKAADAIGRCAEGLAKLSDRINKLNEEIRQLNSKLSTIPPKIKDKDGKEEDNPEYIKLQNEIVSLQKRVQGLMNLSSQIGAIQNQLSQQSQIFTESLGRLTQISDSMNSYNISSNNISCEATRKLGQIRGLHQEYSTLKIGSSSLASIVINGASAFESTAHKTSISDDTPKSAIQKMAEYMRRHNYEQSDSDKYMKDPEWISINQQLQRELQIEPDASTLSSSGNDTSQSAMTRMADYMRRHDYGMGDKDKYMQDPEWIALNGALQEEIKEQEKRAEEYLDLRIPKLNENNKETSGQLEVDEHATKTNSDMEFGFCSVEFSSDDNEVDKSNEAQNDNLGVKLTKNVERFIEGKTPLSIAHKIKEAVENIVMPILSLCNCNAAVVEKPTEIPFNPQYENVVYDNSNEVKAHSLTCMNAKGDTMKICIQENDDNYDAKISVTTGDSVSDNIVKEKLAEIFRERLEDVYMEMRKKREEELKAVIEGIIYQDENFIIRVE